MGDEGGEQEVIVRATEECSEAELLLGSVAERIFRNADFCCNRGSWFR
jgi:hypothetical protein